MAPCVSMVLEVGSLCLYGTGSWLHVSLWIWNLAPCVSMELAFGSLCLYGTGSWLPVSLW